MKYSLLEKIIMLLDASMTPPKPFGIFHVVSMLLVICACVLAVKKRHIFTEKNVPFVILGVGLTMLVFEIYKQFVRSYTPATDAWLYKWYIFPFQFCSTPIYITLLAFLFSRLRLTAVYEALKTFLATYSLVAGAVVFAIPRSVFGPTVGVNIQSMLHHGLMILLAVILLASGSVKYEKKSLIGAFCVFMPLLIAAMIMNFVYGNGAEFDMFYLAPDSTFALAKLRELFGGFPPYPVYLIGYICLFTLGAALVLYVCYKISNKKAADR